MQTHESTEILAAGRFLRLVRRGTWEYAERVHPRPAVVIVAVTPAGELVLVEQFRVPLQARVIELPAGLVGDVPGDDHPDPRTHARRELLEETGFRARRMQRLFGGPVSAGFGTETVEFFLATGLDRIGPGGGVEGEQIDLHLVPLDQVESWLKRRIRQDRLADPKIFAGLYFARQVVQLGSGELAAKPRTTARRRPPPTPRG
jgi:ADP-ribose pyrophosphatase